MPLRLRLRDLGPRRGQGLRQKPGGPPPLRLRAAGGYEDGVRSWREDALRLHRGRPRSRLHAGGVEYAGPIEEFLPLLCMGQLTHVGKRAVFGLGSYSIVDAYGRPLSK